MDDRKQNPSSTAGSRKLAGPVVAVAADGSCIVQRGTHVDVFGPRLTELKPLPIGDTSGQPGIWYAVSPVARYAARVGRTGWIDLWDVAAARPAQRLDPGLRLPRLFEMPMVGPAQETTASWGAPAFLVDDLGEDLLVTHHNEGIVLWEVPTGRARCVLRDPAIQVARETFPTGAGAAVVRSGSNTPGIHNATLVEFSTRDCAVRERHLIPAGESVVAAGTTDTFFVFTPKGIRAREASGTLQALVSEIPVWPHAIHASSDGRWVLWAGADSSKPAEEVVGLWNRKNDRVTVIARLPQQASILHVRLEGEAVHAIDSEGRAWTWPVSVDDGQPVRVSAVSADQLAREKAIIHLGLGHPQVTLKELERAVSPEARASNRFLRAYVQALVSGEDRRAFRDRMAREGVRYSGEDLSRVAAAELAAAEIVGPALDMFQYWLEGAGPGSRAESGIDLGLELALKLGASEDSEAQARLLRRLHEVYPASAPIAEQLKELEEL